MLHFRLSLSGRQREALYRRLGGARQRGDQRAVTRILAMLALDDGLSLEEVAQVFRMSVQTLRNWLQRLMTQGIEGLLRFRKSPGRPPKLTKAQRRELGRVLDAGPAKAGLVGNCWRSPMMQRLIEQCFGVLYSVHYLSQLLKSLGFSYQKAGFISDHLDEAARQAWLAQTWPAILALAQAKNAHVLFGDEASFPQWGTLSYTWARRGCQPVSKTSGKRKGYKVLGLIDYFTGRFFYRCQEERLNSATYEAFLRQVLSQTRQHLILIQDGARYHTSAAMKAFFEQHHERITVFQLPSYSPDFNPIEKLWKKVKEQGTHLHYFPTFESLKDKVKEALLEFKNTPAEVLSLFVKLKTREAAA
jgi:transposase